MFWQKFLEINLNLYHTGRETGAQANLQLLHLRNNFPRKNWNPPTILPSHIDSYSIGKRTEALQSTIKQTMFLLNQCLLPTKGRCHWLEQTSNNTCAFCQLAPKTDKPLMIKCTSSQNIITWLERTTHRHGCRTPPMEFIREHLETVNNQRRSFALVPAYGHLKWEKRKENRIPRIMFNWHGKRGMATEFQHQRR